MNEQDKANREADECVWRADGSPRDPDGYPDGDEAREALAQWMEAEVLGVDPSTLDMLDSGNLEL